MIRQLELRITDFQAAKTSLEHQLTAYDSQCKSLREIDSKKRDQMLHDKQKIDGLMREFSSANEEVQVSRVTITDMQKLINKL